MIIASLVSAVLFWRCATSLGGNDNFGKKAVDMSGQCGDALSYSYVAKTGKLTISGHGPMTSCPWSGHKGVKVKSVEFEEGITSICKGAFYGQSELAGDLVLPSTLTHIGDFAFYSTSSLHSITFAGKITHIGDYAFRHSGIAGELKLPASIRYIGEDCFYGCKNLAGKLHLPASLEKIGRCAFYECSGFVGDLVIPDSVREIGSFAFAECKGLDGRLVISKAIREIPDSCFGGLRKIRGDLVIPPNVQVIGESAFYCAGFDGQLVLPDRMTKIANSAFQYCKMLKGMVKLPQGLTRVEKRLFIGCENLEEVKLSKDIRYICNQAFKSCSALAKIHFPDGLAGIGKYAFAGCKNLTAIDLPRKLMILEDGAFANCNNLGGEPKLPEGLVSIGENCFAMASSLHGSLALPDSVNVLGKKAFAGCTGIAEVTFGEGMKSIGKSAFAGCKALKTARFRNKDHVPDFYEKSGQDDSFPDGCLIRAEKEQAITGSFENGDEKSETIFRSRDLAGKDSMLIGNKEEPYYWTSNLKHADFVGIENYTDIRLSFGDSAIQISVNGRMGKSHPYQANANSPSMDIVITDRMSYKGGYLQNFRFVHGERVNVVQASLVLQAGQEKTVYFVKDDPDLDPTIDTWISLKESLLRVD